VQRNPLKVKMESNIYNKYRLMGSKRIDLSLAKGTKAEKRKNFEKDKKKEGRGDLKRKFPFSKEENSYEEKIYLKKPKVENVVIPLFVIHTHLADYANHISSEFLNYGIQIETQFINSKVFQTTIGIILFSYS
jgi:hypothetical protein